MGLQEVECLRFFEISLCFIDINSQLLTEGFRDVLLEKTLNGVFVAELIQFIPYCQTLLEMLRTDKDGVEEFCDLDAEGFWNIE